MIEVLWEHLHWKSFRKGRVPPLDGVSGDGALHELTAEGDEGTLASTPSVVICRYSWKLVPASWAVGIVVQAI